MKNAIIKSLLNKKIGLFMLMASIALMTIGFSSFLVSSGASASHEVSGNIGVNDLVKDDDYVTLKFNRRYDKPSFFGNVDTSFTDSEHYDKFEAKLSRTNNGSNSNYSGDLSEYFELYDSLNPFGENSPNAVLGETRENIYFENHYLDEYANTLTSTIHYSRWYDQVDTGNTSFDTTEINRQMEIVKGLINPTNGIDVVSGEVTRNDTSFTYLKIYYTMSTIFTKTTDSGGTTTTTYTYQYRFHFFYHIKNSSRIARADTHIANTGFTSATNIGTPTITVNSVTTRTTKNDAFSVSYTHPFATSAASISLNSNRCDSYAGRDPMYLHPDVDKTSSDFDSYDTSIRNWIKSYASASGNIESSTNTVEVASQEDNSAIINDTMKFARVYVSREIKTDSSNTYYKRYRVYVVYFERLSGKIMLLTNGTVYGNSNSYKTSTWAEFNLLSNNANFYLKNETTNYKDVSSITPNSQFARGYFRIYYYLPNATTGSSFVLYNSYQFYESIDTTRTIDDFDKNLIYDYLNLVYSNSARPPSGGDNEIIDLNLENQYPYLVGFMTRYKTSAGKYYRYIANIFCYTYSGGSYTNTQLRHLVRTYDNTNDASKAHTGSDWPSFTINRVNVNNSIETLDAIYSTFSFANTGVTGINPQNDWSVGVGNITGNVNHDFLITIHGEAVANSLKYRSYNATRNYYLIQSELDFDRDYKLNYYIDSDGKYHLSGYYSLRNNAGSTQFDSAFTFNPNLYNCYYGTNTTVTANTHLYSISSTDSTSSPYNYLPADQWTLKDSYFVVKSQLDSLQAHYVFTNKTTNENRTFVLGRASNKTKDLFYRFYNNLTNSDTITLNYEARIKVKPGYEGKARDIINAFDLDCEFSMVKYGV